MLSVDSYSQWVIFEFTNCCWHWLVQQFICSMKHTQLTGEIRF
jgi:hypothetical protein